MDWGGHKPPTGKKLVGPSWASWVPGRTPEFKVQTLGQAKTALSDTHGRTGECRGGILYRLTPEGMWREVVHVRPKDDPAKYKLFSDYQGFMADPPWHVFTIIEHP